MDISQDTLLKYFYGFNERIESHINISTVPNKKKKAILVLSVSMNKPINMFIYIVKKLEKNELKRKLISSVKSLTLVDCHDSPNQPSFDIEFKCNDGNSWRIFANMIEDKHRFIERLMRVIYLQNISLFNSLTFQHLPASINLDDIYNPAKSAVLDSEKSDIDSAVSDSCDFNRYQNLSATEEENLQRFLKESPDAVINAVEFQETLRQHLLAMEGTNVHSIMSSENQLQQLMDNLDSAIEQIEQLENKFLIYEQFLAEVESSMSCLRDRDEIVRLTSRNRDTLQHTLEDLLERISLSDIHMQSLIKLNFNDPTTLKSAKVAGEALQRLLEMPPIEGLKELAAVTEKTTEMQKIADEFSRNIATEFNNALMRLYNKMMGMATSNVDKLLEMHRNCRLQLEPYVDFIAWLKVNRPKSFQNLQLVYLQKMATVYNQEITSLIDIVRNKLITKGQVATPSKVASHTNLKIPDKLRGKSMETGTSIPSDPLRLAISDNFEIIFEDFMLKLKPLVLEEEEFMTRLFRLDCRRSSERNEQVIQKPGFNEKIEYLCQASNIVFSQLADQLKNLIQVLEQHDSNQSLLMVVVVNRQFDDAVRASEFLQITWGVLFLQAKRSFNGFIDRFINSFRDYKPRKSRGILPFVVSYASFAEQTAKAFLDTSRQNDLVTAHQKIVRDLITHIERVSSESQKTPREVILMENYHRMIDILRRLKLSQLDELQAELKSKYQESLDSYVIACVGRPFEKLYDFFENVGTAIESGIKMEDIGYQFAFNRTELKKVIHEYPGKEVKKGLENLCKKVEKYVSEESGLFQVIWLSIQKQFMQECSRYQKLIDSCYPNSNITLEFTTIELDQYFKDIAPVR